MPMVPWKDSSTWKFYRYSLACFMTVVVVFTAVFCFLTYNREKTYLSDALRNIDSTLVPSLIVDLWVTNDAGVQNTIDGMARFRYISRVEVKDDTGRVFSSGDAADGPEELLQKELKYTHKNASVAIGTLSIFVSKREMYAGVIKSAIYVLLLQMAFAVGLSGVMAMAFHLAFGRYLRQFAQFIKHDEPARFDHPFSLVRKSAPRDELQLLVDHFNELRSGISGHVREITAANDELIVINSQLLENERQLRRSEEQFARAFNNAPIGMALTAPDGRLLRVNQSMCSMLGYSEQELLLKTFQNITHPADLEDNVIRLRALLAGEIDRFSMEKRYLHASGRLVWALLSVSLVRDHEGAPVCFISQIVDITERKRAEEERMRLEAQNRQLQKAESLARMAGAIAHRYNNLLAIVLGNLELALAELGGIFGPVEQLREAMDAARRASDVSGLMLAYLGHTVTRREPLDLGEVCRRLLPNLEADLPAHVVLKADLPESGPTIKANADQIRQLLKNLVTNAWEAVGDVPGEVAISVSTVSAEQVPAVHRWPVEFQPNACGYACVEVAESGCGIAEDAMEKLFDPFYSTKFTGRGLGLPVALGMAKAHDGCITVETSAGRGSVFRVFLPLMHDSGANASEPEGFSMSRQE